MNVSSGMQCFQPVNHLLSQIQGNLEVQLPSLLNQHFIKRLSQQVHNHIVVGSLVAILINMRKAKISNSILTLNILEDLDLIEEFRLAHRPFLNLDGDFSLVMMVPAFEDLVERSHSQLLG